MNFAKKYALILFFSIWTLVNFFQAANTVLLNDEAYYWVYSNFLDWGYFDHPPMIAALIKSGYFLFKNELGVRFFMVILNTLTLSIIYHLLPRKNDLLFYAIACSVALMQLGFIAAPDTPLAFFVALFFMGYKKFLDSCSWWRSILLGIVMALLLYSKYQGVLIIACTLLSNLSLLKNKKAYLAVLIAMLLFVPHLYWQYRHGFPSVQYHIFERGESYKISYTVEYILGQLVLAGPFMGWLFLFGAFKYQSKNVLERALKFSVTGIYFFFLISTFKGPVEANWTVPAIIPLIILSHQFFYDHKRWQRILFFTVPISLIPILFIRIYLISGGEFITILNRNELEQNKSWTKEINNISRQLPVVFINSYQKASKYWFYSGIPSFSLNTPDYRRNNYNYWPVEKSMQGKSVYVISIYNPLYFTDSIQTFAGALRGKRIDSFYSHSDIQLIAEGELIFNNNKNIVVNVSIANKETAKWDTTLRLQLYIYKQNELLGAYSLLPANTGIAAKKYVFTTSMPVLLPAGEYLTRLAISSAIPGCPTLNSTNIKVLIK